MRTLFADPHLMGMVGGVPDPERLAANVGAAAELNGYHQGFDPPEVEIVMDSTSIVMEAPGLRPAEVVHETCNVMVNGRLVIVLDVRTVLAGTEVVSLDASMGWHRMFEHDMQMLMQRLHLPTIMLMLGLGMNLSPRMLQLPGMLSIQLHRPKRKAKAQARPVELHMPPMMPAEAATDARRPHILYPGHHGDGMDGYSAHECDNCPDRADCMEPPALERRRAA